MLHQMRRRFRPRRRFRLFLHLKQQNRYFRLRLTLPLDCILGL
jgi:hypothetical protein